MKAYTVEELSQILLGVNNEKLSKIQTNLLIPAILEQKHKPEEQMLFPTTKSVLEEIAAPTSTAHDKSSSKAPTKRNLSFEQEIIATLTPSTHEASAKLPETHP